MLVVRILRHSPPIFKTVDPLCSKSAGLLSLGSVSFRVS